MLGNRNTIKLLGSRTFSQRSVNDADMPLAADEDDDRSSAREFLLQTAARSLDSAFKGWHLLCACSANSDFHP